MYQRFDIADMRMAENHFLAYAIQHVCDVETLAFLGDTGVKDYMVEQISKFLAGLPVVFPDNRIA